MTDLTLLAKTELNAMLNASALNASALKKTSKPDLIRMVLADQAATTPAPAVLDNSSFLTPTEDDVLAVLKSLTVPEQHLLVAFAHCENTVVNAAPKQATGPADLTTWVWLEDRKVGDMTTPQKKGVLSSLVKKGLVHVTPDSDGDMLGWSLLGFDVVQSLLGEELPAMPAKKAAPAPAPKPRAARVLDDRVITQPAQDQKHVKAVTQGSKRHLLIQALEKGATISELMAATGWNTNTVTSALRWDCAQVGLGVERKDGKYYLMLPKGFTRPAIVEKGQAKCEVLLAACKG